MMIWNYISNGTVYLHVIKGFILLYNEEPIDDHSSSLDVVTYHGGNSDTLMLSSCIMIFFSVINLIFFVLARADIKKFLARVIYKHEAQREVSLRFLDKSFEFRLVRVSASYFIKTGHQYSPVGDAENQEECCVICFDNAFDVYFHPCGHSGICRNCLYKYLEQKGKRCIFCKMRIDKMFIISYIENEKQYRARGEIRVDC